MTWKPCSGPLPGAHGDLPGTLAVLDGEIARTDGKVTTVRLTGCPGSARHHRDSTGDDPQCPSPPT